MTPYPLRNCVAVAVDCRHPRDVTLEQLRAAREEPLPDEIRYPLHRFPSIRPGFIMPSRRDERFV